MMNNPSSFVETLKSFSSRINGVGQRQIDKIKSLKEKEKGQLENISGVSPAAASMYNWVNCTLNLYEVHKKVEPLKKKVEAMTKKLAQLREALKETEIVLEKLNKELTDLNENRTKKQTRLDELTLQVKYIETRRFIYTYIFF